MTFWDFANTWLDKLSDKWTRVLGGAAGTLVVLDGTGVIPDRDMKYLVAVIAVLTYWRGSATGAVYSQAKAVLAANPIQPATPAPKETPK